MIRHIDLSRSVVVHESKNVRGWPVQRGAACLMLEYDIRQGLNALGSDFALFVVDLLRLLVAQQEDDGAEQEDRCAPADAVRPPELPHLPVACKHTSTYTRCPLSSH